MLVFMRLPDRFLHKRRPSWRGGWHWWSCCTAAAKGVGCRRRHRTRHCCRREVEGEGRQRGHGNPRNGRDTRDCVHRKPWHSVAHHRSCSIYWWLRVTKLTGSCADRFNRCLGGRGFRSAGHAAQQYLLTVRCPVQVPQLLLKAISLSKHRAACFSPHLQPQQSLRRNGCRLQGGRSYLGLAPRSIRAVHDVTWR